jgi:hypothetical protein
MSSSPVANATLMATCCTCCSPAALKTLNLHNNSRVSSFSKMVFIAYKEFPWGEDKKERETYLLKLLNLLKSGGINSLKAAGSLIATPDPCCAKSAALRRAWPRPLDHHISVRFIRAALTHVRLP